MDTTGRMTAKLNDLGFDFGQFTIERFITWLEQTTGRNIYLLGVRMPAGMYGAWISDAEHPHEYIFYDDTVPPLHQGHIQLHELSHFICQHRTYQVTSRGIQDVLRAIRRRVMPESMAESARFRAANSKEEEVEAETLAMLIQNRVIQYQRMNELERVVSDNEAAASLLSDLGID